MSNPTPKKNVKKPSAFFYPIKKKYYLDRPIEDFRKDFFEVVLSRRSVRVFDSITWSLLSKILWFSSKVIDCDLDTNGYIISHRPAPSAGGIHPVDIVLFRPDDSVYYYNPFEHSVNELILNNIIVNDFLNSLKAALNIESATIIWFVGHPDRTNSKYENFESLFWRDIGAFTYCVQLVCTAMDVNSCPLGTLGDPFVGNMFQEYGVVVGGGGIAIG